MENWKKVEISEIGEVVTGNTPLTKDVDNFGNDYPFVSPSDLNGKKYINKAERGISNKGAKSSRLLPPKSILITCIGNIGKVRIATTELATNQQINALIYNKNFDNEYFYYQIQFNSSKLQRLAGHNVVPILSKSGFQQVVLFCSPLGEQKKIAEILSTWDKSIETTEKLIAAKQKLKKSLMQRLLTGSQRFPEFHGQEWKEVRLKDVFSEIRNIDDGGDTHSVMTISARRGLISQQDKFNRVIAGDSLKKYTQLKRGDFAYNEGNSKTYEMGCIYQLESTESALVPFVYISFSSSEKVFSGFYKHWFLAHYLDRQLKKIITSDARGDGLLNVNSEDFFKLKITLPPLEEQKKIAAVLNSCDAEINVLQSKLGALRQQKRGLMQKLLTGRVRVKIEGN